MTDQSSFSVSVEVDVGIDLGLEKDFAEIAGDAGISASVTTGTETGITQGISKNCPDGPWKCALIIWPEVTEVSGMQVQYDLATCTDLGSEPYQVQYPQKRPDGTYGGSVDVCACKNFAHWADNGAPSIVCPQDCPE